MLNPVLFFDGCAASVVKYLPAGAHQVPREGDAVLCSLSLPGRLSSWEDLDLLLGGRHLLWDLERNPFKAAFLCVVILGSIISPHSHTSP